MRATVTLKACALRVLEATPGRGSNDAFEGLVSPGVPFRSGPREYEAVLISDFALHLSTVQPLFNKIA